MYEQYFENPPNILQIQYAEEEGIIFNQVSKSKKMAKPDIYDQLKSPPSCSVDQLRNLVSLDSGLDIKNHQIVKVDS